MSEMEIRRHSGVGVASFLISMLISVLTVCLIIFARFQMGHQFTINMKSPTALMLTEAVMLIPAIAAAGFGLGISGVVQKSRRRIFAWFGLSINAIFILAGVCLMILAATRLN